jgi:glycosyltransferase involved in cell wall biosynthesis
MAAYVRYRALQYFPYLERHGIACELRSLFDTDLDRIIYTRGRHTEKLRRLASRSWKRVLDLAAARRFDVVVVLREAFLVGPPLFEILLKARRSPFVFDVDDAVWEPYDSPTYGRLARWLKCAWKADPIARMAAAITAGNRYIADHFGRMNASVTVLPTVVDTELYRPPVRRETGVPVLGWIGSHSTFPFLKTLLPVLDRLANDVPFRLRVVGAGATLEARGFPIDNVPWTLASEIADVQSFDVGLFPSVEDGWSRGKSGFKAVQYGAVGIPTVAAPAEVHREIVVDGETGLFAQSPTEWLDALRRLLDDPSLRERLGRAARERIDRLYSLRARAPELARVLSMAVAADT